MFIQLRSHDRESVERQVVANLWGQKAVRLTAEVEDGQYCVSIHSPGDEPDGDYPAATPRS